MNPQITVKNLKREFVISKKGIKNEKIVVEALKGISFSINKGEIFGLLGANGAGKTTTIKILSTLLLPSSGNINILGWNPITEEKKIRPKINFIYGGERSLYWRLTARENLQYFADLYKLDRSIQKKRINELLETVGLTDSADNKVETFSKGMKQRLQVARGLINDPEILFLDEPTIGLDPIGAKDLRNTLKKLKSKGTTILLTTHDMYEADMLCDNIGILKDGEMVAYNTPEELKKNYENSRMIKIESAGLSLQIIESIHKLKHVVSISEMTNDHTQILEIKGKNDTNTLRKILEIIGDEEISNISTHDISLEDVYFNIMEG